MIRSAAIVTIGSELTEGLRLDTNSEEIASALATAGMSVAEIVSVGDDATLLAETLARLVARHALVVTTGGLGPTHDDITRDAASHALGRPLVCDERIAERLQAAVARHREPEAGAQVLTQALVLEGADVIDATTGTAPGQIAATPAGLLALLPGPPTEMRPMLARVVECVGGHRTKPAELGIAGMTESDVQVAVQRAAGHVEGIGFTVLARPGDVRAVFFDTGGGAHAVAEAARLSAEALGDACYTTAGETLAEVVIRVATEHGSTIAAAESCTGGMVSAALTDVAGSSAAFLGAVVSYSNEAKAELLGVTEETLVAHGAVSRETAAEMARGATQALGAEIAVAITGIAGPTGGTAEKPVGTVWFALAISEGNALVTETQFTRLIQGDRAGVRLRATAIALDVLRRALLGLPVGM